MNKSFYNKTLKNTWKLLCCDFQAMMFNREKLSIRKFISSYFFCPGFKAVILYRAASYLNRYSKRLASIIIVHCLSVCGAELHDELVCGPGLVLRHPVGVVINANAKIGQNCTIGGSVTIGQKSPLDYSAEIPRIGNNVFIGNNTTILGQVNIGDNVIIGANSLVIDDIQSHCVAAGNPLRVISSFDDYKNKIKNE